MSRVHELARMSMTELIGIHHQMLIERNNGQGQGQVAEYVMRFTDKDQVVTAIRNLEDPAYWDSVRYWHIERGPFLRRRGRA